MINYTTYSSYFQTAEILSYVWSDLIRVMVKTMRHVTKPTIEKSFQNDLRNADYHTDVTTAIVWCLMPLFFKNSFISYSAFSWLQNDGIVAML